MSYQFAVDANEPHLGGNIVEGDPLTHSPRTWDYLIERFALKSVMDLGSGTGHAAWHFHKRGIATVAIDGLVSNIINSAYPTVLHDLCEGPVVCKVDMVTCVEVAEHIDVTYVGNLINSLACGKYTVMSHASPGQGGHHHVNCQNDDYWINLMQGVGGVFLDIDTQRVRAIAGTEGAFHLSRSGLVFANRSITS